MIHRQSQDQRCLRQPKGASLIEFALSLFVLVFVILFPLANLASYLTGVSLALFLCNQAACVAAHSARYADALAAVRQCEQQTEAGVLASLVKLRPVSPKTQSCTLYIVVTDPVTKSEHISAPNTPCQADIVVDPSAKIYEYKVSANFNIGPLLNLKGVPIIGEIPAAGKEAAFSCSSSAQCENPEGISN